MRRQSLFGGIAAAIFVIVITASSPSAQTLIQGTVTDFELNPIQNAIVTPAPSYFRADTTDSNGYFSLLGYPAGMYNFGFRHFDYFDTFLTYLPLGENDTITVNISMRHRQDNDVCVLQFAHGWEIIEEYVPFTPSVVVGNLGLMPQSFPIYYELTPQDSTRIISADTIAIENMPPNSIDTVAFARSFTLPPGYPYRLIIYSLLLGDQYTPNDTIGRAGIPYRNFFIIYGNKDGSIMPVHNNQLLEIPVWGGTPLGDIMDTIGFMHIPLATDDNVISQRLGGYFPDTLLGRWDDITFLSIDNHSTTPEIPEGYSNQSILGFANLTPPRDEQNFLNTNGDTVLLATYRMRVTSDTTIIGDTLHPFITGYNHYNGGLYWGDANVLQGWVPRASFPTLYIQSLAEWGCHYIPGDVNWNGVANGIDVTYAVSYLKGAPHPPVDCNPPCTEQPDPFYAAMDVNGSCSVNGIDITYFVSYLKGGAPFTYCHSCPPAGD